MSSFKIKSDDLMYIVNKIDCAKNDLLDIKIEKNKVVFHLHNNSFGINKRVDTNIETEGEAEFAIYLDDVRRVSCIKDDLLCSFDEKTNLFTIKSKDCLFKINTTQASYLKDDVSDAKKAYVSSSDLLGVLSKILSIIDISSKTLVNVSSCIFLKKEDSKLKFYYYDGQILYINAIPMDGDFVEQQIRSNSVKEMIKMLNKEEGERSKIMTNDRQIMLEDTYNYISCCSVDIPVPEFEPFITEVKQNLTKITMLLPYNDVVRVLFKKNTTLNINISQGRILYYDNNIEKTFYGDFNKDVFGEKKIVLKSFNKFYKLCKDAVCKVYIDLCKNIYLYYKNNCEEVVFFVQSN